MVTEREVKDVLNSMGGYLLDVIIQQQSFLSENVQCSSVRTLWLEADAVAFMDDYFNYIMGTSTGREFMYVHAERTGKKKKSKRIKPN